jgi:phosphatidylserine/phosphatidylglycerophosphate/cardiolipin synthase-like enzyme
MSTNKNRSATPRNAGLIAIVVIALALLSQLTGIDLLSIVEDPAEEPVPTVAVEPPASSEDSSTSSPLTVYFTAPTGESDSSTYVNGTDTIVAASIREAQQTLDMAAFELNSQAIADALLDRHRNGVRVRIVTDDDHGLDVSLYEQYLAAPDDEKDDILDEMEEEPDDTLLDELYDAGIPIVDDDRSALMHNKFIIIDSAVVWTGSMNLTVNGSYRNNNNFMRIRSSRMAQNYQAEFDEMFVSKEFGPRSPANTPFPQLTVNDIPMEVYFSPEDGVIDEVIAEVNAAQSSIRYMAFSFTENTLGDAVLARAAEGITVEGVIETVGSLTEWSELSKFYCAGLDARQDGNKYILHHKVIIIDDSTVVIGSFNFSGSATESNDENLVIIHDAGIAAQYLTEWRARFEEGHPPEEGDITCN